MTVLIEHLLINKSPIISVTPTDTLEYAVSLMIEHDYTQLPVYENGQLAKPAKFVTSHAITRATRIFNSALNQFHVSDALVEARTVQIDDDLFSKMNDILLSEAVIVLNSQNEVQGILTNYDTTQYFRSRAEDLILIEDIETTLKDHLRSVLGGDEENPDSPLQQAINALSNPTDAIKEKCNRAFRSFCAENKLTPSSGDLEKVTQIPFQDNRGAKKFSDLTLGDYINLALARETWGKLEPQFNIEKDAFKNMMEGVRKTRNKLMHFNPDFSTVERDGLKFCANWFKSHQPPLNPDIERNNTYNTVSPIQVNGDIGMIPNHNELDTEEDNTSEPELDEIESKQTDNKYAPLALYLSKKKEERITLSFTDIEEIIQDKLPAAAREHRSWWANDKTSHVQSKQWIKARRRVAYINFNEEKVVFALTKEKEWAYIDFFSHIIQLLNEKHADMPLSKSRPNGQQGHVLANFPQGYLSLGVSFASKNRLRLELYIDKENEAANLFVFHYLKSCKIEIEDALGYELEWEELPGKQACRIAVYTQGSIKSSGEDLAQLVNWVAEKAPVFYQILNEKLENMPAQSIQSLKNTNADCAD
ncbi:MAG: DUF4268 domain-containing protein [Candidatus Sericytochromatia bacterium]